ncbi:MAG: tetratricopeptide repeat protein [Bacteroidales bacterium]
MEILKTIKFNASLICLMIISMNIISQDAVYNAFKQSYTYEKSGDFKKAVEELKKVYDETSYEINLRLGWLNYQAGVFTESVAHYQKAVNLMPYSEEAKFGLILPKAAVGKWDEVIAIYQKILSNSPNNTVACYRLGLIYYGKKDYDQAYKYFEKVVNLYPFDYDGLIMYAWTNFQMGKTREAKVLFNKALLYAPDDKSAAEGLKLIK